MSTLHSGIGQLIRVADSREVSAMTIRRTMLSLMLGCGMYAGLTGSYAVARDDANEAQAQQAPTADDQKNDSSDVQLAARIRKAIVDDKNLSTSAHNVKIIVRSGSVTLRGSVDSEQEKDVVRSKAEQIAGTNSVHDLLDVKRK